MTAGLADVTLQSSAKDSVLALRPPAASAAVLSGCLNHVWYSASKLLQPLRAVIARAQSLAILTRSLAERVGALAQRRHKCTLA